MAILTESAVRAIRIVNAYILKSHSGVIPDLIGYPENKKTSCADFVRWILGSSPRMTEEKMPEDDRGRVPEDDRGVGTFMTLTFHFNNII